MKDIWINKKVGTIHLIDHDAGPPNYKTKCGLNLGAAANTMVAHKNIIHQSLMCEKCAKIDKLHTTSQ